MQVIYLESSLDDIEWMRFYYRNIFPSGKKEAIKHIKTAENLLVNHPDIGQAYENNKNIKELVVNKTPFTFIYRVKNENIEILRLWDQRGNRSHLKI
ncbi:MAG: type II toxin-antitoxin system RelE/ParE family toxin [Cellulophaga sp.]